MGKGRIVPFSLKGPPFEGALSAQAARRGAPVRQEVTLVEMQLLRRSR